jgi:hypothetical protein
MRLMAAGSDAVGSAPSSTSVLSSICPAVAPVSASTCWASSFGPWRGLEDLEYATLEWVDWFNHQRLSEAHGQIPRAEYEAIRYRQQESLGQQAQDSNETACMKPGAVHLGRVLLITECRVATFWSHGTRKRPVAGPLSFVDTACFLALR